MAEGRGLKLRARDPADLQVISAVLQDALVPLRDLTYLRPEQRFVMVANRFMWEQKPADSLQAPVEAEPQAHDAGGANSDARFEDAQSPPPPFNRVNCGITFDKVTNVRFRGFEARRRDQILNLLAIEAGEGTIQLQFSGSGAIRLDVAGIRCHLEDLGEPWPTHWQPQHDEAGDAAES